MTNVQIEAGTLTASHEDRILSGLLLPYGEVGNTNLGRFTVPPGVIQIPTDVTVLAANTDHKREHPVARFLTAVDTAAGIVASFLVGKNPEGDALLAEVASDDPEARKKLSVEVSDVVLRGGKAIAGRLFGASFVKRGAFPSATLMAADVGGATPTTPPADVVEKSSDEFTDENGVTHKRTITRTTHVEVDADGNTQTTITEKTVIDEPADPAPTQEEAPVGAETIPNTLTAKAKAPAVPPQPTLNTMFAAFEAIRTGRINHELRELIQTHTVEEGTLFAALTDVPFTGGTAPAVDITRPQWIDELWSGLAYRQKFVGLFNHADLTSKTINGWRWVTKPAGGTWAGNGAAINSNAPDTEPYTETALSFAGGHSHAREYIDFNTPGYFESYYKAMTESYAQWADETVVLADILTAAGAGTEADDPTNLAIGAGMSAIIDGAAEVIAANALPSFALVETSLWKQIAKTPQSDRLAYLNAALGLNGDDGKLDSFIIRPTSLLGAGEVLVGARDAATVYELPGTPIRAEAPNIANGKVDTGVFGYAGTVIHKADALQLITPFVA